MSLSSLSGPAHPTVPLPAEPPTAARMLGHLSLVPLLLGALLVWLVYPELQSAVALALAAYAAITVTFLGGIHWGLAMRAGQPGPRSFRWAAVPPVVAWLAVVMPAMAGLALLGVMLVVCYLVDRRLYPALGLGHWLTMRFRFSMLGALSCFLGAAGA